MSFKDFRKKYTELSGYTAVFVTVRNECPVNRTQPDISAISNLIYDIEYCVLKDLLGPVDSRT